MLIGQSLLSRISYSSIVLHVPEHYLLAGRRFYSRRQENSKTQLPDSLLDYLPPEPPSYTSGFEHTHSRTLSPSPSEQSSDITCNRSHRRAADAPISTGLYEVVDAVSLHVIPHAPALPFAD